MGIFSRIKDLERKINVVTDSNSRLSNEVKYLKDEIDTLYTRNEGLSFKIDNPGGIVYFSDTHRYGRNIKFKFVNDGEIVDLSLIEDASCLYKYKIKKMSEHVLKLSVIYRESGKKYDRNSSDMKKFVVDIEDISVVELSNLDDDEAIGWVTITDF